MNAQQERIARFVKASHLAQRPDSPYFAADGGIAIQKVADALGLSIPTVQADADTLAIGGDIELTVRTTGTGLRATPQLFSSLAAIDTANAASEAALVLPGRRAAAAAIANATDVDGTKWRGLALIVLDELNALRQWASALGTQVAAASTLADLKARVGTLPRMPDRTMAQVKNAYLNHVNTGDCD